MGELNEWGVRLSFEKSPRVSTLYHRGQIKTKLAPKGVSCSRNDYIFQEFCDPNDCWDTKMRNQEERDDSISHLPELEGRFGIQSDVELMQLYIVLYKFREGKVQGTLMIIIYLLTRLRGGVLSKDLELLD